MSPFWTKTMRRPTLCTAHQSILSPIQFISTPLPKFLPTLPKSWPRAHSGRYFISFYFGPSLFEDPFSHLCLDAVVPSIFRNLNISGSHLGSILVTFSLIVASCVRTLSGPVFVSCLFIESINFWIPTSSKTMFFLSKNKDSYKTT